MAPKFFYLLLLAGLAVVNIAAMTCTGPHPESKTDTLICTGGITGDKYRQWDAADCGKACRCAGGKIFCKIPPGCAPHPRDLDINLYCSNGPNYNWQCNCATEKRTPLEISDGPFHQDPDHNTTWLEPSYPARDEPNPLLPGSPARMIPLLSTFTTLIKPSDTTIEDTPAPTESHNCNGYTSPEHPLVGRPGHPCNETESMHLPDTTAKPHVPGHFSPHPSPTDSTSINPATVLDKRQCDPNNNGCSACSECCVFKLSIFNCDTAIFHSQLVVKADTQCRDITTIFGNDPAIMISECTGWFDTCYIYWRAGCRQEDLGTAKTIHNVAGQCISFGQFPFGSIKCFGEGSGGP